jgi:Resolvase, N terminal domain
MIVSFVGGCHGAGRDRHVDRLRPLLHRRTRPRRPAPDAGRPRGCRRRDLPGQRVDGHQPAPARPGPGPRRREGRRDPRGTQAGPAARSVPDARDIGDSLVARGVKPSLSGTIYDPTDPMGKKFFNILATFAEFEVDLLRLRTREGMATPRPRANCAASRPISPTAATRAGAHARHRRLLDRRVGRAVQRRPAHGVPGPRTPPCSSSS